MESNAVGFFVNKFITADASGRALVDTRCDGEGKTPAAEGEQIIVQGRFDNCSALTWTSRSTRTSTSGIAAATYDQQTALPAAPFAISARLA